MAGNSLVWGMRKTWCGITALLHSYGGAQQERGRVRKWPKETFSKEGKISGAES